MTLKAVVEDIEKVPEGLRDQYVKHGDTWVLDIEDKDYKTKLAEFRDNNTALAKRMKELENQVSKYKDVDLEKYGEAMQALEKLQEQKDKELIDEGKVEELIAQRTERMRADYDGKLEKLLSDNKKLAQSGDKYRSLYTGQVVDTSVIEALSATKAKPQAGAMRDILARAKATWQVDEDGNPIPMRDGKVIYGKEGNPLSMTEWAGDLMNECPYLFEGSSGGGAGGSGEKNRAPGAGAIDKSDQDTVNRSIEDIAAGRVVVNFDK